MQSIIILCLFILITSCVGGSGEQSSSNNAITSSTTYYSSSLGTNYRIEIRTNTGKPNYFLTMKTLSGYVVRDLPLTPTDNGFSFILPDGYRTGNIIIKNGQFGISFSSALYSPDFATVNAKQMPLPNGNYTTLCDQENLSPCTIKVDNGSISITAYTPFGTQVTLCSNERPRLVGDGYSNPYIHLFGCGVPGRDGQWAIMPFTVNGVSALMISEYNTQTRYVNDYTSEIAFPQIDFALNGAYNYLYKKSNFNEFGLIKAMSNNGLMVNPALSCGGSSCPIIYGSFYNNIPMQGFAHFVVNGNTAYNLVGNTTMNIYMDSFSGFYF